jgi:hypothetical protein
MSSWALILALSGFQYSAPDKTIAFNPKLNEDDFSCFFSTGSSWGTFRQKLTSNKREAEIEVLRGGLELQRITLNGANFGKGDGIKVALGGKELRFAAESSDQRATFILKDSVSVAPGSVLRISSLG